MKKSVRLISILLAMIMCLSCASVGVFAEYADYSRPAGTNALDHPVINAAQCGSMILDKVDDLLREKDIKGHIGYGINFDYDVTSIDAALRTIHTLVEHKIWSVSTSWVGDIRRLDFSSLLVSPYRTSVGSTDLQILYAMFGFLSDNAERIGKLVDGEWDNGSVVGIFLDLNDKIGDVHQKIKDAVYDALFKNTKGVKVTKSSTIDDMVNEFLYTYIGGKNKVLDSLESEIVSGGAMTAPGVTNFKLGNITVYQLLRFALRAVIKDKVKPLLTDFLSGGSADTIIPLLIGLLEIEVPEGLSKEETVTFLVNNLLDLRNGALSKFIRVTDDGISLTEDFQSLLHTLLSTAQGLMSNLTSYDTVEKWDNETLATLSEPQMLAYLVRTVITGLIDYMDIPKTMPERQANGTVREVPINGYGVATYVLIDVMTDKMPEVDYYSMIENYKTNSQSGEQLNPGQVPILERDNSGRVTRYVEPAAFTVLADYMYYYLNAKTTMDIPAGLNFDETLQWIVNWAIDQWGGLVRTDNLDLTTTPTMQNMVVWKNLDILLWNNILNITWLPDDYVLAFKDSYNNYTGNVTRSALLDNLLYTFVNLDMSQLNNILSLFNTYQGTVKGYPSKAEGELNQNVIKFILTLLKRLLNGMFQSDSALFANTNINCLEDLVSKTRYSDKTNLRWLAEHLSQLIAVYGEPILLSALPLVAESLTNLDQYEENYDIFPRNNENYNITDLRRKLEAQSPSNKLDADMLSDDDYFFFGSEDFDAANLYKYYNWREVYRQAKALSEKYEEKVAEIEAMPVTTGEEIAEKATATDDLAREVTVLTYRLGYYFELLVERNVNVAQLRREINEARETYGYGAYGSMTAQGAEVNGEIKYHSTDFTLKTWTEYNEVLEFAKRVSQTYNTDPASLRQAKITAARRLLVVAQKQLKFFTGAADYSVLNQLKLLAKAILDENDVDPTAYFQDTIADLRAAYTAAEAVNPGYDGSDQNIIDEVVLVLQEAYDAVTPQPAISKVVGSTTVLDKTNGYVYGMREKLTNFLSYISKRGTGVLVYNLTGVGAGTGTGAEIGVTLEAGGQIVQKYTVVIFGDLDGDCRADATDANWVYLYKANRLNNKPLSLYAMEAMDANGDGDRDLLDAYYLRQAGLLKYTVDQRGAA